MITFIACRFHIGIEIKYFRMTNIGQLFLLFLFNFYLCESTQFHQNETIHHHTILYTLEYNIFFPTTFSISITVLKLDKINQYSYVLQVFYVVGRGLESEKKSNRSLANTFSFFYWIRLQRKKLLNNRHGK